MVYVASSMSTKADLSSGLGNRLGRGDECVWDGYDDFTGADAGGQKNEPQASVPLFTPTQFLTAQTWRIHARIPRHRILL